MTTTYFSPKGDTVTIDEFIQQLEAFRALLGGDAPVVVRRPRFLDVSVPVMHDTGLSKDGKRTLAVRRNRPCLLIVAKR